jgi:hypothetical protein
MIWYDLQIHEPEKPSCLFILAASILLTMERSVVSGKLGHARDVDGFWRPCGMIPGTRRGSILAMCVERLTS